MVRPEHLEALVDLGYSQQESRFLYLAATHSGYFTLRQFLDFTGTEKVWNVQQFTSKSIGLGHVQVATCGYRTSLFNLYSRKVYGALDRDDLRNRRRLSSELIRTRLLILDFVLAHPGLEYLETEADKIAYFLTQLGVPEALIPGRVYKGINPNATTKRCFVDRFPVFFSMESDCPLRELIPTFVYCDSANRGLFHYTTHLRYYEHFLRRLSAFCFVYAAPSSVKFNRAEQFFRGIFEENSATNVRSIARYFRVRRLWDENKHSILTRADRDSLRYGNHRIRDEFSESVYRKRTAGGTEEQALEASWKRTRRHRSGGSAPISCPVTTTFLGANPAWIAERELPRIVLYLVLHPVLMRRRLKHL
jgi:hypothetical protein